MNDFTKEELKYMAFLFCKLNLGEHELYLKLDSMITHYCDLNCNWIVGECISQSSNKSNALYCATCGKVKI